MGPKSNEKYPYKRYTEKGKRPRDYGGKEGSDVALSPAMATPTDPSVVQGVKERPQETLEAGCQRLHSLGEQTSWGSIVLPQQLS